MNKKKIVVLSGAGISAESGLKTFRDSGGLWEGRDVMEVASIHGWRKNPHLVLTFYNERRKQLLTVEPNAAHLYLAKLEKEFDLSIITQNVDDLHERAGSQNVIHLHGELTKMCSEQDKKTLYTIINDIKLGDVDEQGIQLRPFIVWFGEDVPLMNLAIEKVMKADILIIIGTSMLVYPAAGLIDMVHKNAPVIILDPKKPSIVNYTNQLIFIEKTAVKGIGELSQYLKSFSSQ